ALGVDQGGVLEHAALMSFDPACYSPGGPRRVSAQLHLFDELRHRNVLVGSWCLMTVQRRGELEAGIERKAPRRTCRYVLQFGHRLGPVRPELSNSSQCCAEINPPRCQPLIEVLARGRMTAGVLRNLRLGRSGACLRMRAD